MIGDKDHFIGEHRSLGLQIEQDVGLNVVPIGQQFGMLQSFQKGLSVSTNSLEFGIKAIQQFFSSVRI